MNRLDRICLPALGVGFLILAGLTLSRSALLPRRCGDLNVFARAGWAARTGADLYDISDDNGFHYLYPPTFAILFSPLADAPEGAPRDGLLPYGVTVLYWYFFNVICLVLSAHWLACAVEQSSPVWSSRAWFGSRGWWGLRLWPMLACLPPVGHTLIRGQVGMLLLLFMSGMILAVVRRKNWQAGAWLACAICLKVIPALLLIYPLLRRDVKLLAGCAVGLLVGLIAIPVSVRGPQQAWRDYQKWNQVMLSPALANGADTSRANEVLNVTATDSQSFLAMIHNTAFLDRETRPKKASTTTRWFARAAAGLLLAMVLAAGWRRVAGDGTATVIFWGALIEVMLLASPVCHLHYFCLSMPLVAGLISARWENQSRPALGGLLALLISLNLFANIVPHVPGMEVWRDVGLAGYTGIGLVIVASAALWRRSQPQHAARAQPSPRAAA
ncbi:MAG TPA: glycosyltransferase family 87 protein [Pirellulales bacterium]|nr:glycosyltransferase family 87 protein [Pirellulales bacterium]